MLPEIVISGCVLLATIYTPRLMEGPTGCITMLPEPADVNTIFGELGANPKATEEEFDQTIQ
jgi:hypothetical protein